ncbi:MAG: MG2 domain-containing protein [Bacteroidales bacterium]
MIISKEIQMGIIFPILCLMPIGNSFGLNTERNTERNTKQKGEQRVETTTKFDTKNSYPKEKISHSQQKSIDQTTFIIEQAKLIREKEDDATEKIINLICHSIPKVSQPGRSILHSFLALSLYEYYLYENNNSAEAESETPLNLWETGKLNGDYSNLSHWKKTDFLTQIRYHLLESLLYPKDLNLSISDLPSLIFPKNQEENSSLPLQKGLLPNMDLWELLAYQNWDLWQKIQRAQEDAANTANVDAQQEIDSLYTAMKRHLVEKSISNPSFSSQSDTSSYPTKNSPLLEVEIRYAIYKYETDLWSEKQYLDYLQSLSQIFAKDKNAGDTYYLYALAQQNTNPLEAEKKAAYAINHYPGSWGCVQAMILQENLLTPTLNLHLEEVYPRENPLLATVSVKNVAELKYEIYLLSTLERDLFYSQTETYIEDWKSKNSHALIKGNIPLSLKEDDLKTHSGSIGFPSLATGTYLILAYTDSLRYQGNAKICSEKFTKAELRNRSECFQIFQVSNIGFACSYAQKGDSIIEGYTVNRNTGKVLPHTKIQIYSKEYNYPKRQFSYLLQGETVSDQQGFFTIEGKKLQEKNSYGHSFLLSFHTPNDSVHAFYNRHSIYLSNPNFQEKEENSDTALMNAKIVDIKFISDRPVYSPGEKMEIRGIVLSTQNGLSLSKGTKLHLQLRDARRKTQKEIVVETDSSGAFSCCFPLSAQASPGRWTLEVDKTPFVFSFSVEAFKRPSFFVTLERSFLDSKNQSNTTGADTQKIIYIKGQAQGYDGQAIQNAKITYRVNLLRVLPWRFSTQGENIRAISIGNTLSTSDGSFTFSFPTEILSNSNENNYFYFYAIECEVSDLNGETQSAEYKIRAQSTPLRIFASLPEIIVEKSKKDPSTFPIQAWNAEEKLVPFQGKFELFSLKDTLENSAYSNNNAQEEEVHFLSYEVFHSMFPLQPYYSPKERDSALVKTLVFSQNISNALGKLPQNLSSGYYEYRIKATDSLGNSAQTTGRFHFYQAQKEHYSNIDTTSHKASKNQAYGIWMANLKSNVSAENKQLRFLTGSFLSVDEKDLSVLWFGQIEDGSKRKISVFKTLSQEQLIWEIACDSLDLSSNWSAKFFCIKNNQLFQKSFIIKTPIPDQNLKIDLLQIPKTITTKSEQTWQFKVSSNVKKLSPTFLSVGLYDASIEEFSEGENLIWPVNGVEYDPYGKAKDRSSALLPLKETAHNSWDNLINNIGGDNSFGGPVSFSYRRSPFLNYKERPFFVSWEEVLTPQRFQIFYSPSPNRAMAESSQERTGVAMQAFSLQKEKSWKAPNPESISSILRTNFDPTSFFYSFALTDSTGLGEIRFKAPDQFGRWKFRIFAYQDKLWAGYQETSVIVNKPLMLYPQLPRFVRNGDSINLLCKIQSSIDLIRNSIKENAKTEGKIRLEVSSLNQGKSFPIPLDQAVQSLSYELSDTLSFSKVTENWTLVVPSDAKSLAVYFYVEYPYGDTLLSDAIVDTIPVYSNRIAIKQFVNLFLRPGEEKKLPALKIPDLKPSLEPNKQDSIIIEFFASPQHILPQLLQSLPIDSCITSYEALLKMMQAYLSDGSTSWTPYWEKLRSFITWDYGFSWTLNAQADPWMSLYILKVLGENIEEKEMQNRKIYLSCLQTLSYLDKEMLQEYRRFQEQANNKENVLTQQQILYLYVSSLFVAKEVPEDILKMREYYRSLCSSYATKTGLNQQAYIASYFMRIGQYEKASPILKNLKRLELFSLETGLYWKKESMGYTLTQRMQTASNLARMYLFLGKSKQSAEALWQANEIFNWMLSKERTVDFIGGGLSSGDMIIAMASVLREAEKMNFRPWAYMPKNTAESKDSAKQGKKSLSKKVQGKESLGLLPSMHIQIGKTQIKPDSLYFKKIFTGKELQNMIGEGKIKWDSPKVQSSDFQISPVGYGSLCGIATQEIEQIQKQENIGGGLNISRYYVKEGVNGAKTEFVLGDKVKVILEIEADRDFSYVHIHSLRPAGLEWLKPTSAYDYGTSFGFYRAVSMHAIDFYINFLPKGRYILSYDLKAEVGGSFADGPSTIESLFSGGFGANSAGGSIRVNLPQK